MPKGKQSASNHSSQAGPSGSQMGPPLSQTQQSQAEKAAASLGNGEINKKVDELVQYLLVMDQKKVPIKKQDINKMVLKDANRAFSVIMKKASERLTEVFGIEVLELQDKHKGSYILVNSLDKQQHMMAWPQPDNVKTGLLTAVLSIVYMSGNVVKDGELWHGLKSLGIDPDRVWEIQIVVRGARYVTSPEGWIGRHAFKSCAFFAFHQYDVIKPIQPLNISHETFGDVKKLVTQEFVKQGYLEFTKLPNTDQPVFEVRWGQRAKLETSKMQILKFVSLMYGKEPEQWTTQYQDAKNDAQQPGA